MSNKGQIYTRAHVEPDIQVQRILQSVSDDLLLSWRRMIAECESPIERLLMAAMIQQGMAASIRRQAKFGPYRIDLVIWRGDDVMIAIEADGWDWHYRNKIQVQRDHTRDRYLQSFGWIVLRFTGSEIVEDPARMADEIKLVAIERHQQLHRMMRPAEHGVE